MTEAWHRAAPGIFIEELAARRLSMVRLGHKSLKWKSALESTLGVELSDVPNVAAGVAPQAIWMGPNEWMVVGDIPATAEVEQRLTGANVLIVDVSDGRFAVRFSGRIVRDLIAKASSLDLHPRVFWPGRTAMTIFSQVPVVLHHKEGNDFDLYFDVSHRAYVRAWVDDALWEYGEPAQSPFLSTN